MAIRRRPCQWRWIQVKRGGRSYNVRQCITHAPPLPPIYQQPPISGNVPPISGTHFPPMPPTYDTDPYQSYGQPMPMPYIEPIKYLPSDVAPIKGGGVPMPWWIPPKMKQPPGSVALPTMNLTMPVAASDSVKFGRIDPIQPPQNVKEPPPQGAPPFCGAGRQAIWNMTQGRWQCVPIFG